MRTITRTATAGLAGITFAVAVSSAALAADISGTWQASVKMETGQSGSPTFVFKQSGNKLSGTYSGAFGTAPVTGSVSGSSVRFSFGSGTQTAHYVGTLAGSSNSMSGNVDYAGQAKGTFNATRQ